MSKTVINPKASKVFLKHRAVLKGKHITERELLNLKKALNGYASSALSDDERKELNRLIWNRSNPIKITPEQAEKGIAWLRNQWKTPRGIERKNNPFGYREEDVIENFKRFEFVEFYDDANYYMIEKGLHSYYPIYRCIAKDGSSFEYYVSGGEVNIIG